MSQNSNDQNKNVSNFEIRSFEFVSSFEISSFEFNPKKAKYRLGYFNHQGRPRVPGGATGEEAIAAADFDQFFD